ncbi:MAG: hypothetical protein AAGL24_10990 [Pseudomonadota bacterium]
MTDTARIADRLARDGLALRGGFHPNETDTVPRDGRNGPPRTVLLVGVIGRSTWDAFQAGRSDTENPLDDWTRSVVDPLARDEAAIAIYPNDKPFWPFQQWAKRSEPVSESPLGLLIHPRYGLWHAYRAALVFADRLVVPQQLSAQSPCETCADRPCLRTCPVGAFTEQGFNVAACAGHLVEPPGRLCLQGGCAARDACPVGQDYRYDEPQIRFHMAAFGRSVASVRST